MARLRPVRIEPLTYVSVREIAAIYFAILGATWLLLEPLSSFGLLPRVSILQGWIGYGLLLLLSLIGTAFLVPMYRRRSSARTTRIVFSVASSSDGAVHVVRSPDTMLVADFLHEFTNYLSKGPGGPTVRSLLRTHHPVLQTLQGRKMCGVSSSMSLKGAGIVDGSHCEVVAFPRLERVLFCKGAIAPSSIRRDTGPADQTAPNQP
jgi:hypothetical protein